VFYLILTVNSDHVLEQHKPVVVAKGTDYVLLEEGTEYTG
jgi:hypothetical protein